MTLEVDTSIPFGNAADVCITDDDETPEVSFAADPHGGPECLWFCFRLKNGGYGKPEGKQVRLVLKHLYTMLGGNRPPNLRPVMRPAGEDWVRMEPGVERFAPDGQPEAVWVIDLPQQHVDVAFCYPYGPPDVETLVNDTGGYWRSDTIGVSQAGRPLVRLSNRYGEAGDEAPGLYFIARQHSGETPGSWVLDGILRHFAETSMDSCVVWAVPLSNVDGVVQGDYGKDNFPYDLNRAWGQPPMRHETLVIQRDLARWRERCRPALTIDFHAPGGCEADGLYCYLPNPEKAADAHAEAAKWAEAVSDALTPKYAAPEFGRVINYASRWETPNFTSYCANTLGLCGFALETPYAIAGETLLIREGYRDAGERIADALIRRLG